MVLKSHIGIFSTSNTKPFCNGGATSKIFTSSTAMLAIYSCALQLQSNIYIYIYACILFNFSLFPLKYSLSLSLSQSLNPLFSSPLTSEHSEIGERSEIKKRGEIGMVGRWVKIVDGVVSFVGVV